MKIAGVSQSEVSEQWNFVICLLNNVKFNHDVDSIANAVLMYDYLLLETAIETYVSWEKLWRLFDLPPLFRMHVGSVARTGASWWRPYCPVVQMLWSFTAKAGRPSAAMADRETRSLSAKAGSVLSAEGGLDQGSLCV
jgi:hypothetical protein